MSVRDNIRHVRQRVREAALRAGRDPGDITITAVTKQVPVDRIREVVDEGLLDLGENRVQEMTAKMGNLPGNVRWHMIGHLQTNKVKKVVGRVKLIHSLDRLELARAIERKAREMGVDVDVLIQVNVSGEKSKFGISPVELKDFLVDLQEFNHIKVKGLMTIAPNTSNPEESRPFFRELRRLAQSLDGKVPGASLEHLSMGMTNDYEVAVEEGADILRLGTAIFGARAY